MYKGTNQSSWRIWVCDVLWFYGLTWFHILGATVGGCILPYIRSCIFLGPMYCHVTSRLRGEEAGRLTWSCINVTSFEFLFIGIYMDFGLGAGIWYNSYCKHHEE